MKQMITAYVYDKVFKGMPVEDAAKLTHLNYSFARIRNGRADTSHWQNEKELERLIDLSPDLTICLSVGGWGADGFSQASATPEGRETLAQSMLDLLVKYGFRGLDIDWEYPNDSIGGIVSTPQDAENFPLLINLIREKLDRLSETRGERFLLTMAVGAAEKCARNIHYGSMAAAIDYINVMTYDMAPFEPDHPTWHHAALHGGRDGQGGDHAGRSIGFYRDLGVPADKLVLGIAFYGRRYTGVRAVGADSIHAPHDGGFPEGINYDNIQARIGKTAERYWDDCAKAPYIYDFHEKIFATYEDAQSIAHKTAYAREMGLAGVMFWEYAYPNTGDLLRAVYEGMNA